LEENRPDLQMALLDKHETLRLAERAGVGVPWYRWKPVLSAADAAGASYPLLVKPIHSHRYSKVFNGKLRLVHDETELSEHLREVQVAGLAVMLCEFIPGEDDRLCSYYTYVDGNGNCLFDFTKRIIRRMPKHFGMGCYHITEWLPDVAEAGRRFLLGIGFRGLANVEFKRDPRDGQLKIIECNPRFTAVHQLLIAAGIDTSRIVYDVLSGQQPAIPRTFAEHKRLLYPIADLSGFRRRRARGEMSLRQWLASIAHRQTFPRFQWLDPLPALVLFARECLDTLRRRLG
jgi:predicted ATP-grasp superfamily ATP-dependent carboligase